MIGKQRFGYKGKPREKTKKKREKKPTRLNFEFARWRPPPKERNNYKNKRKLNAVHRRNE
jgi:hypothetical protein